MKIADLRQLTATASTASLEKALAEAYKQVPKSKKDELDVEITAILRGEDVASAKSKVRASDTSVPFETLRAEIDEFLENAYAQNYFAPNRVIPKKDRPKWRFKVMNFIKELMRVPVDSDDYPQAVNKMIDLYKVICYACNYYLFSTEDAFRSIGWGQPELFDVLVKMAFAQGYSDDMIGKLVGLSTSGGLSREALHIMQEVVLLDALETSDAKHTAIIKAKDMVSHRFSNLSGLKKYADGRYEIETNINELCNFIMITSITLSETEDGMKYYFANSKNRDDEITMYRALNCAEWMDDNESWLQIYDYGISKGIKPRDELLRMHEERC